MVLDVSLLAPLGNILYLLLNVPIVTLTAPLVAVPQIHALLVA